MKKIQYNQIVTIVSVLFSCFTTVQAASSLDGVPALTPFIFNDFAQAQNRLAKLNDLKTSSHAQDVYQHAKAQAWIDFAKDLRAQSYFSNTVAIPYAKGEALITQLEAQANNISMATPLVLRAAKVREDLWQKAEAAKRHANFRCAAAHIAQSEVMLVQAGHANNEFGWRQARPYLQGAERLSREAQGMLGKDCPKSAAAAKPVLSAPPSEPALVPMAPPSLPVTPEFLK